MEKELPFVSVIILNYNGKQHLKECFESLKRLNYPVKKCELIMADNASSDDSVEYVRKNFPEIKVIKFNKNYGYSGGNNKGVKYTHSKSDYVVFLNNDTVVDENWLIELIKPLKDSTICGSASKTLNYYNKTIIDSAGGKITPIGGCFAIGQFEKDVGQYNKKIYVGTLGHGSILIKKEIFNNFNGFDEDYFIYQDDVDLLWNLWLAGYKLLYVPTSILYHKYGASGGDSRIGQFRIYYVTKNTLMNIVKHFEKSNIIKGFVITIFYSTFRIIMYSIKLRFESAFAIVRGYFTFLVELPKTLKKRKNIQKNRKISDKRLYELGVIAPLKKCIKEEFRLIKMNK